MFIPLKMVLIVIGIDPYPYIYIYIYVPTVCVCVCVCVCSSYFHGNKLRVNHHHGSPTSSSLHLVLGAACAPTTQGRQKLVSSW